MGTRFTGSGNTARRSARIPESVSPLDAFVSRLVRLGATGDEVLAVQNTWDDQDGWLLSREQLVALPDASLRSLLENARAEYKRHTTDEADDAEAAEAAVQARREDLVLDLARWMDQRGPSLVAIREWVGTDRQRAAVALERELATDGPRKTLVAFLEQLRMAD